MRLYARLGPRRSAPAPGGRSRRRPVAEADDDTARPLRLSGVPRFDLEADVVVVGHGAAGGSAAIEAARAGAEVLVLERASRGGGAAALSTGLTYFGGGTRIQRACGFEDTAADMQAYVRLAARSEERRVGKQGDSLRVAR